jgi:hypothetical protein
MSYYTIPTNNNGYAWQPEAITNNNILTQSDIMSNWKYRQYIQNNGKQIMKYNTMSAIYSSGNNPYLNDFNKQQDTPYLFSSVHDISKPFNKNNSDLKNNYLEKEQLASKMISPYISTNNFK